MITKTIDIMSFYPDIFDATTFYRGIGPLHELKDCGIKSNMTDRIHWTILKGFDIFFILRPFLNQHIQAIEIAKECRKKVWIDYDDLLIDIPINNPFLKATKKNFNLTKYDIKNNVLKAIKLADLVTVSTDFLKDQLEKELGKDYFNHENIQVLNNAHDDYLFPTQQRTSEKVIMWRGSNTHTKDLDILSENIIKISEKNSDYKFVFMGYDHKPLTRHIKNKHLVPPTRDILAYFKNIVRWKPKLFIVPLDDSPFNKAKSNIAGLEANYAGAVAIAPYFKEWVEVASAYDSNDDFIAITDELLNNDELFMLENRRIYENIKKNYLLSNINKKRALLIKDLVNG